MRTTVICILAICLFAMQGIVFAQDPLKNRVAKMAKDSKDDIDPVIKELLKQGTDSRELVKTCIQMGYEVCKVANSALVAGADRQQVIFGALDGGATTDNLNRCEGLGYSYDPVTTIETPRNNAASGSVPGK